jgi:outer membrane cobalamin receptor
MDDRLKFTGSIRYDKSQNFNGDYSPRLSLVYSAGEQRNHNFRASFQTGFRNPTTQDQYIGFNVGSAVLLGSAPDNLDRYTETLPITSASGQAIVGGTSTTINGNNAYFNSYTAASAAQFAALAGTDPIAASALLRRANVNLVQPETVKAFELGYRGQIKNLSYDITGYYNIYNDFIGNVNVVTPLYGVAQDAPNPLAGPTNTGAQSIDALVTGNTRVFQLYTNTGVEVRSLGFGAGFNYRLPKNFEFSANYNFAEFDYDQDQDPGFEAGFNTPKHRVKASISNDNLFKNFGFSISGRWNTGYRWESTFVDGWIDEATVFDAQINYNLPKLKSVLKIGATNILGNEYQQVLGAGFIGSQYFASLTINP